MCSARRAKLVEQKRVHAQGSLERSPRVSEQGGPPPYREHGSRHHEEPETGESAQHHAGQRRRACAGARAPGGCAWARVPSLPGRPGGPGPALPPHLVSVRLRAAAMGQFSASPPHITHWDTACWHGRCGAVLTGLDFGRCNHGPQRVGGDVSSHPRAPVPWDAASGAPGEERRGAGGGGAAWGARQEKRRGCAAEPQPRPPQPAFEDFLLSRR